MVRDIKIGRDGGDENFEFDTEGWRCHLEWTAEIRRMEWFSLLVVLTVGSRLWDVRTANSLVVESNTRLKSIAHE